MKGRVITISATKDLIDRLTVKVEVGHLEWGPGHYRIVGWEGNLVFTSPDLRAGSSSGGCGRLPLRWRPNRSGKDTLYGNRFRALDMESSLPRDALDQLERLRDGGGLACQVEGFFTVFQVRREHEPEDISYALLQHLSGLAKTIHVSVQSENHTIPRDKWLEILNTLRPENRRILEVAIPAVQERSGHGEKVLQFLDRAQRAFDEGRYPDSLRDTYTAVEALKYEPGALAALYSDDQVNHFKKLRAKTSSALNRYRHHNKDRVIEQADRVTAQSMLAIAKSLAALYLRAPASSET